jgi:hypothetical protein
MRGILYETVSILPFMLVTVLIGGLAAWQMGRAIALTWRPFIILPLYALFLTLAVRFFHFALFEGTLLSLQYFLIDFVMLFAASLIGWRMRRAQQMKTQYSFAYESTSPLTWKRRTIDRG